VQTRALLAALLAGKPLDVRPRIRQAPLVPELTDALEVLGILREATVPMALIHDEYGQFAGLITPADILEAIAGVFKADAARVEPSAIERDDGSWLVAGALPLADKLGITLPEQRGYQTLAGFVLAHLRHFPKPGDRIEASGWRFEVLDLDGRRIDKVLATRTHPQLRRER
jgi:putative hemolysin